MIKAPHGAFLVSMFGRDNVVSNCPFIALNASQYSLLAHPLQFFTHITNSALFVLHNADDIPLFRFVSVPVRAGVFHEPQDFIFHSCDISR